MHDTYYVFYTYQKQWDFTFGWRDWWTGNIVCCAQLDLFVHYAWPYGKHCWKEEILVIIYVRHIKSQNLMKATQIPENGRKTGLRM